MTKEELIAALQADPSPGNTPVVVRGDLKCVVTVSELRAVRRYRINDQSNGVRVFLREPAPVPDGILTLTLS